MMAKPAPIGNKYAEGMGRPEKEIDWDLAEKLMISGCTCTEIAPHFNMFHSTFGTRVEKRYGKTFTELSSELRQKGDSLLRDKQFEKATSGDNMMLIWLGKNRLQQRDSPAELSITPATLTQFGTIMSQLSSLQKERNIEDSNSNAEDKS